MNSALASNGNFPSDAANVIVISFQDEATPYGHGHSDTNTGLLAAPNNVTTTDIASLRSAVSTLNGTNSGFYRGAFVNVAGYSNFQAFMTEMRLGTTNGWTGTNANLANLSSGSDPTFVYEMNIVDGPGANQNTVTPPLKPDGSEAFDQWQYYYLYWITHSLNTLGFTPDNTTWPIIIDD
jgi:hypothetical protein